MAEQHSTRRRTAAGAAPRNAWQRLPARHRARIRDAVLSRYGTYCWQCGSRATEVDHVVPISQGGSPTDLDNCRPSCARCNRVRGASATGDGAYGAVLITGPDRPADAVIELDMDALAAAMVGSEDPPAEALQVVAAAAYHAAVVAARRLQQPVLVWARPPRQVQPASPIVPVGPSRPW